MITEPARPEKGKTSKEELEKLREFAYRAPSPDSEPPTMQEESESLETEGATAPANPPPRNMDEALLRDPSPDDLDPEEKEPPKGTQRH